MKKHIELVKKFLADNDSVTLEELRANQDDAGADWDAYDAAYDAACRAYDAAYWAYSAAADSEHTEYYKKLAREAIAEYEELTR